MTGGAGDESVKGARGQSLFPPPQRLGQPLGGYVPGNKPIKFDAGSAMLIRAVLAIAMSSAVATGGLELYPAALGVLIASKAYGVVRSAVVPRLLPPDFSLVRANSRVTLAGLLATGVAFPLGAGLHKVGLQWPLYGACVIFLDGAFLAFSMPRKVDSAKGERKALLVTRTQKRPSLRTVGPSVLHGLQANAAHRAALQREVASAKRHFAIGAEQRIGIARQPGERRILHPVGLHEFELAGEVGVEAQEM